MAVIEQVIVSVPKSTPYPIRRRPDARPHRSRAPRQIGSSGSRLTARASIAPYGPTQGDGFRTLMFILKRVNLNTLTPSSRLSGKLKR